MCVSSVLDPVYQQEDNKAVSILLPPHPHPPPLCVRPAVWRHFRSQAYVLVEFFGTYKYCIFDKYYIVGEYCWHNVFYGNDVYVIG